MVQQPMVQQPMVQQPMIQQPMAIRKGVHRSRSATTNASTLAMKPILI